MTLTNEQKEKVNRHLHKVMEKHWHDFSDTKQKCSCGANWRTTEDNPDYCSDLESRALLHGPREKAIELVGSVEFSNLIADQRSPHPVNRFEFAECILSATAEQIALACFRSTGGEDL